MRAAVLGQRTGSSAASWSDARIRSNASSSLTTAPSREDVCRSQPPLTPLSFQVPRCPWAPPQSSPPTLAGPRPGAPLPYEGHVARACPDIPNMGEDRAVVSLPHIPDVGEERPGVRFPLHSPVTSSSFCRYPYARWTPSIDRAQCPSACLHSVREVEERRALLGAVPLATESLHAVLARKSPRHRLSGTATPGTTLATPCQLRS